MAVFDLQLKDLTLFLGKEIVVTAVGPAESELLRKQSVDLRGKLEDHSL